MSTPAEDSTALDSRFEEAVAEFLRLREEGTYPDTQVFLQRYPDLAPRLEEYFAGLALFDDLAVNLAPLCRTRPTPDRLPAGTRIGGFELLGEVGRGGMGIVYRARQIGLNRLVALKMILGGAQATTADRDRFRLEAEAVAQLQHPYIVRVLEISEHQGQLYQALEFCSGGTLTARLTGTALPPREAAALVQKLALAMQAVHHHGIVHRDLKPSNVLFDEVGEPKVTDFGLAKLLDRDDGATRSGMILGTPSYMAPEQAAGQTRQVGPASDIYALGAILYECLTGRPPFKGASLGETLEQVRTREPVSPRALNPGVPRDLETVCLKALAKEPARRYASAEELAADLGRFLAGEPVRARPLGQVARLGRWCWRNPVVAGLTAAVVLLLMAGVAISTAFAFYYATLSKDLNEKAEAARRALGEKEEALTRQKESADLAQMRLGRILVEKGLSLLDTDPSGAVLHFDAAYRADHDDPARAELHRLRLTSFLRQQQPRLAHLWSMGQAIESLMFSPDGRRVLVLTRPIPPRSAGERTTDGEVRVWDVLTGQPVTPVLKLPGGVSTAQFLLGGRRVLTTDRVNSFRIWDAATGEPVTPLLADQRMARFVYSSRAGQPSDRTLVQVAPATGTEKGGVRLWNVETGVPVIPFLCMEGTVSQYHLAEDIARLLTVSVVDNMQTVRLWDVDRAQGLPLDLAPIPHIKNRDLSLVLSPDFTRVLTFFEGEPRNRCEARVWDMRTGKAVGPAILSEGEPWHAHFNKDGSQLLLITSKSIQAWNTTTGVPVGAPIQYGIKDDLGYAIRGHGNRWTLSLTVKNDASRKLKSYRYNPDTLAVTELPADIADHTELPEEVESDLQVLRFPDGSLQLWDGEKGKVVGEKVRGLDRIRGVEDLGRGQLLVRYAEKGIQSFSIEPALHPEGQPVRLALGGGQRFTRIDAYGKRFVYEVHSLEGIRVWEIVPGTGLVAATGPNPGASLGKLGPYNPVKATDPSASRMVLAYDRGLCLWGPASGTLATLTTPGPCTHAAFSADGSTLIAGTAEGTVFVWDLTSAAPALPTAPTTSPPLASWVSPDGRQGYLLVERGGDLQVRDATTGALIGKIPVREPALAHAEFSTDGRRLLLVGRPPERWPGMAGQVFGGTVRIWEIATGQEIVLPPSFGRGPRRAVLSADGRQFYAIDGLPGYFTGSSSSPSWFLTRSTQLPKVSIRAVRSGAVAREGWIETADGQVSFDRRAPSPRADLSMRGNETLVDACQFREEQALVLLQPADKLLQVSDGRTGRPFKAPMVLRDLLLAAEFVDDDHILTVEASGRVTVWDLRGNPSPVPVSRAVGKLKQAFVLSSNDLLLVEETGRLRLVPVLASVGASPERVLACDSPPTVAVLRGTGAARRLATLHQDGKVRLWDPTTGKAIGTPLAHTGPIVEVDLGQRLVVTAGAGIARLWTTEGKPLGESLPHEGPVQGARICSVGALTWGPKRVQLWNDEGKPVGAGVKLDGPVRRVFPATTSPQAGVPVLVAGESQAQLHDALSGRSLRDPWKYDGELDFLERVLPVGLIAASRSRVWSWSLDGQGVGTVRELAGRILKVRVVSTRYVPVALTIREDEANLIPVDRSGSLSQLGVGPVSLRHGSRIVHAAFGVSSALPQGCSDRVVTVGIDGVARMWMPGVGEPLAEMRHDGAITRAEFVAMPPRGSKGWGSTFPCWLMTVGEKEVRLWDPSTGEPARVGAAVLAPFSHAAPLRQAITTETSHDSKNGGRTVEPVLATCAGTEARLWDLAKGQAVGPPLRHDHDVAGVWFTGRRVATLDTAGVVRLWDGITGKLLGEPLRHTDPILFVSVREGGAHLLTFSASAARLWDAATGRPLGEPEKFGPVPDPVFSAAGFSVLLSGSDGSLYVWDWSRMTGLPLQKPGSSRIPVTARFTPAGDRVLTATFENVVRLWDATTGQAIAGPFISGGKLGPPEVSPDGRYALLRDEGSVRLLDLATGDVVPPHLHHYSSQTLDDANAVACLLLTSGTRQPFQSAAVFVQSVRSQRFLDAHVGGRIGDVVFHPDGRTVFAAALQATPGVAFLQGDLETGTVTPVQLPPLTGGPWAFAISPDGSRLVALGRIGTPAFWMFDLRTSKVLADGVALGDLGERLAGRLRLIFSPDGRVVVIGSSGNTRAWDAATGQPLTPPLIGEVSAQPFSPDCRLLVTVRLGEARLWDVATGQLLAPPFVLNETIESAAFSPDGRRLILRGKTQCRAWDLVDERTLEELSLASRAQTGRELDPSGNLLTLDILRLKDSWSGGLAGANSVGRSLSALRNWHRDQLEGALLTSNWLAARTHASWLIQAEPAEWLWHACRGRTYLAANQAGPARLDFEAALNFAREEMLDWLDREAAGHEKRGGREAALLCLDLFLTGRPDNVPGLIRRVNLNIPWQRWDRVGPDLELARILDAASTRAHIEFLAASAESNKDWARLHFYLDKLIRREPNNVQYLLKRARTLVALGHNPDADYRKALEVDPVAAMAEHEQLVRTCEQAGAWAALVACYDRMMGVVPDSARYHEGRAGAYFHQWKWEEAIADYTRAIDLGAEKYQGSSAWYLWNNRGIAHANLGKWEKAAADFATAQQKQAPARVWFSLALTRLQQGADKGYRRICADMLERFGKSQDGAEASTVAWACALIPGAVADYTVPLALARQGATKEPWHPAALTTLGTVYFRAGQDEKAIETLMAAIQVQRKGGTPADWLVLAMAHQRCDRPEQARRWLDHALADLDRKEFSDALQWMTRIELQALRREAQAALRGP
jgi:WD40 repeat protein/tetratricopeptide (TPR) repeat protein